MIRKKLNLSAIQSGGPLEETLLPTTLEDVALQMESIADDNTDMALCHIEADRLLLTALSIVSATCTSMETKVALSDIIANFHKVDKIYE